MSQCVSCANQPNTNDSLGGAAHEGTVTPMVVGIIVGTVIVFVIVVCALFYCVKLENHRYMAKVGDEGESHSALPGIPKDGGGEAQQQPETPTHEHMRDSTRDKASLKSRPSFISQRAVDPPSSEAVPVAENPAAGGGKRRLMFGWGRKGTANRKWWCLSSSLLAY